MCGVEPTLGTWVSDWMRLKTSVKRWVLEDFGGGSQLAGSVHSTRAWERSGFEPVRETVASKEEEDAAVGRRWATSLTESDVKCSQDKGNRQAWLLLVERGDTEQANQPGSYHPELWVSDLGSGVNTSLRSSPITQALWFTHWSKIPKQLHICFLWSSKVFHFSTLELAWASSWQETVLSFVSVLF